MVSNGQIANATTFNNAFGSKTADNVFAGIQDLANAAAASGTTVVNAQREHNGVASFTGRTLNGAKDQLPTWTDNSVGLSTNNLKDRAEALTTYAKALSDNKITGPASATDNAVVRYDATTGKLAQNSGVIIDDSNNVTGVNNLTADGVDHNIGTTNTATQVDIAIGTGVNTVNIGGANTTINMVGTVTNQNVTNMNVTDKLVTFNDGGAVASGFGSGFEVEENGIAEGYVKTSADRNSMEIKAPNAAGIASITPGASNDTVGLLAATQVFTNKDYDGGVAANSRRLTLPKDTTANLNALTRKEGTLLYSTDEDKVYFDDGITLTAVGTGAGSGGINYIDNPGAETNTAGWVTYDDATENPVDGLGGVVTTTWTRSTTATLRDTGHFILTKDAANRRGEGVAYAFTIDNADKAKVLQISFDYKIVSGTYADDDISIWIIKDPAGTPLANQPAPYLLKNHSTNGEKWFGEFQTDSSVSSYAFLVHIKSTSALAYVVAFDNFIVGPQAKLYGSPITDWVAYTPTITHDSGALTNYTTTGMWRRVGDNMELNANITINGAAGTFGGIYFSLPSGVTIDTAKQLSNSSSVTVGRGAILDSGSTVYEIRVTYGSTTTVGIVPILATGTWTSDSSISQTQPMVWASPDQVNITTSFPITGWGSSAIISNDADTRIVLAVVEGDPASATAGNPIIFPTKTYDTHNAYNTVTGKYLVPVPGYYRVAGYLNTNTAGSQITIEVDDVGIFNIGATDSNGECAIYGVVLAKAGQSIHISPSSTVDATNASQISFEKVSGLSQIMASESNNMRASNTAGTSIANAGDIIVPFATESWDSHGQWVTDTFTAQQSGKYEVKAQVWFASATYAAGNRVYIAIYKNGSLYSYGERNVVFAIFTDVFTCEILDDVQLLTGETIKIYTANNRTAGATTLDTGAGTNYINIKRVGNY